MTTPMDRDRERDHLLEHEYDGIREYDNPLPGWWVWLFVVTIVFSAGYYAYYQLGPGPTILAEYETEMRLAAEREARQVASAGATSEAELRRLQANQQAMAKARDLFGARCAACHGPQGQGLVGPNLADEFWLHGGTLAAIRHSIAEGVPEKGMVPWKHQLKPDEIEAIAAFVGTLRGTRPPNAKPPEGERTSGA